MLTRKADRVEFAARRAQAATDAFVRIDHARATGKATSSFRPNLLFSKCGALTWRDARLSTRKGTTRHLTTRMIVLARIERDIALIQLNIVKLIAPSSERTRCV